MADPNNVILHSERLVFALPHKSANTSVKTALLDALWDRSVELRTRYTERKDIDYVFPTCHIRDRPEGYGVVGVIRNPQARFWSSWFHLETKTDSTKPWARTLRRFVRYVCETPDELLNPHARTQAYNFCDGDLVVPATWLCVERLADDWQAFAHAQGWPRVVMPHKNRRNYEIQTHMYTNAVRERYAKDWELYARVS